MQLSFTRQGLAGALGVQLAPVEAPEHSGDCVDLLAMELAEVRIEQFAVRRNDHRERQADEVDAPGFDEAHDVVLPDQYRVIEAGGLGEFRHVVGEVDRDADDLYAGFALFRLECLEQWNLTAARRAPGRPEVEQPVPARPLGEVARGTVEVGKPERGMDRSRRGRRLPGLRGGIIMMPSSAGSTVPW